MPRRLHPPRPSESTPAHAAVAVARRILCASLRWPAGLTWARVGWTCALATALALNSAPHVVLETHFRFDVPIAMYVEEFLLSLPDMLVFFLVLMLLATAADNLPLRGTKRVLAFALALVVGVLAAPLELCLVLRWNNREVCADFPSLTYFADISADGLFANAILCAVIGVVWFSYRRDAAAAATLHAVALERSRLQRRTLDAGLKTRQARAEPEFLLDILTAVAATCENDADRAERMIDELVAYLRAALPDDRDDASTLGRELRLTEAYLELVSLRTGGRVRRAIDVPTAYHAMPCAPAVLLPLVACLVPHRCVVTGEGIGVRIATATVGERFRVMIVRNGRAEGTAPNPLILRDLRARLRDLYGDAASLAVDAASGVDARAVLVLPRTLERLGERNALAEERVAAPEAPFDRAYQGA